VMDESSLLEYGAGVDSNRANEDLESSCTKE
jgi:hypothetical protein